MRAEPKAALIRLTQIGPNAESRMPNCFKNENDKFYVPNITPSCASWIHVISLIYSKKDKKKVEQ